LGTLHADAMRGDLIRVIEESGALLPADLDEDTSLVRSGLLDSTALFAVAMWLEEHVTPGLDLTSFDLVEEWDTIRKLLSFIETHARTAT
jgi:acyl carrier protein